MKRDFIQDILANLIVRRNKVLGDRKIIDKNEKNLSLVDRNAYEEIIKRDKHVYYGFPLTLFFVKLFFCVLVFLLGFVYFYGNGIISFKEIAEPIFMVAIKVILFGILIDVLFMFCSIIFEGYNERKLKRKLLLNKK